MLAKTDLRNCFLAVLLLPSISWAKASALELRLQRLEQSLENHLSMDMISHIETLTQEIRELRGQLEEQENEVQLLNRRQEKLYIDLEQRLNRLAKDNTAPVLGSSDGAPTAQVGVLPAERQAYDKAFALMEQKNYAQALTAFQDFIWQYPKGQLVPNAYYWLGEIYLAQAQQNMQKTDLVDKAVSQFTQVKDKYGQHHKAIDALLKLGLIETDRENWRTAAQHLKQLQKRYPDSSRARIADTKLKQMQQQGKL